MVDIDQQILDLEEEIRKTPHHKATDHHIGRMRAKIARLKDQQEQKASKSAGGGGGYAVKKQGDATVVLVGPPSVGKSTLLTKLTNAKSKIAPYAFTTLTVVPGMLKFRDANIQILDVPGIIAGAEKGRGRGREVLSVARGADLIILMTDVKKTDHIEKINDSLYKNGIRLNGSPPNVIVERRARGNVMIKSNIKQDLDTETFLDIAKEFGYKNAEIKLNEKVTLDQLIDAFSKNRVYVPSFNVINKADMIEDKEIKKLKEELSEHGETVFVSAELEEGIDALLEEIWKQLNFVRVYLVKREEEPSFDNPIVVKVSDTLQDVVNELGQELRETTKRAKVWGNGAVFAGQTVPLTTQVVDGMQVRFLGGK